MAPADLASEGPKLEDPPAPHLFGKVRREVYPVVSFHLDHLPIWFRGAGKNPHCQLFLYKGYFVSPLTSEVPYWIQALLFSTSPISPAHETEI